METIKNYLENLFSTLPKNSETKKLKAQLLDSMTEKYQDYKNEGLSENEAIGRVISEFGNIDELLEELDIMPMTHDERLRVVDIDMAYEWVESKQQSGLMTAIGVFLCIMAGGALIFVNNLVGIGILGRALSSQVRGAIGLIPMFMFLATAVGLFIIADFRTKKFKYLDRGFYLAPGVEEWANQRLDNFGMTHTLAIIIGVALCITAPLAVILPAVFSMRFFGDMGAVILLSMIAFAVFIFIYFGSVKASYEKLLKVGDYKQPVDPDSERLEDILDSIMWPMAVIIFLLAGFIGGLWHIAWIVFPITALLQEVIEGVFKAARKK